jgi:hypothetical protein
VISVKKIRVYKTVFERMVTLFSVITDFAQDVFRGTQSCPFFQPNWLLYIASGPEETIPVQGTLPKPKLVNNLIKNISILP